MTAAIGLLGRPLALGGRALATGGVRVFGLRAAQAANIALSENAQEDLERRGRAHSSEVVPAIRAAARARGGQAALMARTVRRTNTSFHDQFQVAHITAGGALPVGRRGVAAQHLIFGAEFGSTLFKQFPARLKSGYWFFRTVEATMSQGSLEGPAADHAVRKWAGPTQQHD
jgi:hypothetical protein